MFEQFTLHSTKDRSRASLEGRTKQTSESTQGLTNN